MLRSITLKNYKSFKDETTIEVKPLTILCGVNSSGKSSIMKSLLMLKQSFQNHNTQGEITYNEKYVNNGSFSSMAYNVSEAVVIKNTFEIKSIARADRNMYREMYRIIFGKNIKTKKLSDEKYSKNPFIVSFHIEIKNKMIVKYAITLSSNVIDNPVQFSFNSKGGNTYRLNIKNLVINNELYSTLNHQPFDTTCYFEGIIINNLYATEPPKEIDVQPVFNYIYSLMKNISTQYLNGVEHIAPLRNEPLRFYISDCSYSTVGISGENSIQLLHELSSKKTVCTLAPKDSRLRCIAEKNIIHEAVNSWLEYIEMGKYEINESDEEIIRLLIENRSIVDVGFGVSQTIPIVVEGAIMNEYQTLLLEQPEIHLHPKAQMKIADYLLSLAICNKNLIVETHSDHIINRIVRRCLENPEFTKLVSILFLSRNKEGITKIEPIHIDNHLGIASAPIDFFDQYVTETETIIQQGYANMIKDSNNNV